LNVRDQYKTPICLRRRRRAQSDGVVGVEGEEGEPSGEKGEVAMLNVILVGLDEVPRGHVVLLDSLDGWDDWANVEYV
jgi:hypothetical protein